MPFKSLRKKKPESGVPTDSFSDIAFLLIIFFILVTSLKRIVGFETELPSSKEEKKKSEDKTPTVTLKEGWLLFCDADVTMEELQEKLANLKLAEKTKGDEKIILLDATLEVDYQSYYEVMSSISAAGGVVGIMTEDK